MPYGVAASLCSSIPSLDRDEAEDLRREFARAVNELEPIRQQLESGRCPQQKWLSVIECAQCRDGHPDHHPAWYLRTASTVVSRHRELLMRMWKILVGQNRT